MGGTTNYIIYYYYISLICPDPGGAWASAPSPIPSDLLAPVLVLAVARAAVLAQVLPAPVLAASCSVVWGFGFRRTGLWARPRPGALGGALVMRYAQKNLVQAACASSPGISRGGHGICDMEYGYGIRNPAYLLPLPINCLNGIAYCILGMGIGRCGCGCGVRVRPMWGELPGA